MRIVDVYSIPVCDLKIGDIIVDYSVFGVDQGVVFAFEDVPEYPGKIGVWVRTATAVQRRYEFDLDEYVRARGRIG